MTRPKITRTVQINDGSWYAQADYTRDICCDCCLVHDVDYKFENGVLMVKTTVNRRETNKLRKQHRVTVKQDA